MTAFADRLPLLRAEAAAEHAATLTDLQRLVERESPSSDLPSLRAFADQLLEWVSEVLGPLGRAERVDHSEHGPTLVIEVPGSIPGRVVVVGHYDTVWPLGTLDSIPFSVDEGIVRGPGVLDMKAGLVTGVRALRFAQRHGLPHPTVTFVFNGDEELGSRASRPIIEREAAGALAGLVLEPGVDWDLKVERKGVGVFTIRATGVESHSGNDPAGGASAINALAEVILQLSAGSDYEAGTSLNVGLIRGGSARNVIAGSAEAEVDVRVTTAAEAERIDALLSSLIITDERVALSVDGGWNRPPMTVTSASTELIAGVQHAAEKVRSRLGLRAVGGGSDANFISAMGIPVLDGLGASGNGPHARSEHVIEDDIDDRILLLTGILTTAFTPSDLDVGDLDRRSDSESARLAGVRAATTPPL